MSLRTLDLPLLLNTSDHDLFRDFFVPALTHAFRYDRGVGYFASGWLRLAARANFLLSISCTESRHSGSCCIAQTLITIQRVLSLY
jgi:hypothetical protein